MNLCCLFNVIYPILSADDNKYGQKMLEKFGWSQGKGLGANESGRLEHVKLQYKNDSRGGYLCIKHINAKT